MKWSTDQASEVGRAGGKTWVEWGDRKQRRSHELFVPCPRFEGSLEVRWPILTCWSPQIESPLSWPSSSCGQVHFAASFPEAMALGPPLLCFSRCRFPPTHGLISTEAEPCLNDMLHHGPHANEKQPAPMWHTRSSTCFWCPFGNGGIEVRKGNWKVTQVLSVYFFLQQNYCQLKRSSPHPQRP